MYYLKPLPYSEHSSRGNLLRSEGPAAEHNQKLGGKANVRKR